MLVCPAQQSEKQQKSPPALFFDPCSFHDISVLGQVYPLRLALITGVDRFQIVALTSSSSDRSIPRAPTLSLMESLRGQGSLAGLCATGPATVPPTVFGPEEGEGDLPPSPQRL